MRDLIRSELRRFGRWALLAALVHLVALWFEQRTGNLLQEPFFKTMLQLDFYMIVGLAFGLVQVGSYRKPSQWMWLIHRPLPPHRIFLAIAASAAIMLGVALLLPLLVFVASLEAFTTHVVDVRHYVIPVHGYAFAMMAWLAGCHAMVSRHKAAIAVVAMPMMLALHLVSVWWLLIPVVACFVWLGYVAAAGFRADRESPPKSGVALLATAVPLQLGFFVLIVALGKAAFVVAGMLLGVDPLNTDYPPRGGLIEVTRKEPGDALVLGLAASADPRAASWREQLPLLEPVVVGAWLQRFPLRHQLANLSSPTQWFDEKRGVMWTFSHDRMLFLGRDPRSGTAHGAWGRAGKGDETPFDEIPFVSFGHLVTRDTLYAIDADEQRLHRLLALAPGEVFIEMPERELDRVLVLTNRRLAAYRDDRDATSRHAPPVLDWSIALPAGVEHLERADVAALMDGWLVSFLYGSGMRQIGFQQFGTAADPRQYVVFVDPDGAASVVAERAVARDYPAMHQVPWWVSPPLHVLSEWPDAVLEKGLTVPLRVEAWPREASMRIAAGVLMLASLALAAWWLRGANVSPARRRLWLATCGLLGVPAFLSLVCLQPRTLAR
ncbi:MAG TPA: hypothetical protein VFO79_02250 [Xanthomonadales bacterium]|nr:hypothetical protein [Xanthomonadales bacterium]